MLLVGITCMSNTGKLLELPNNIYKYLNKHASTLDRSNLRKQVIDISPPLPEMSSKSIKQCLELVSMQVYASGHVVTIENG